MKTRMWLLIGVLAILAVVGLAGCGGSKTAETTAAVAPSLSVALPPSTALPPAALSPVSVNVNNQQGIWVNGHGTVTVTPDIASLSLGVSVQSAKVADAQSQAAGNMDKVMSALNANGIDKKNISTSYYNINQVTRYDNSTQQNVVTGYQVSNIVNVTIRSIDKVGTIIDAVAVAAGDSTRINSINFSVSNPAQYYSQARTLAMNDAKSKATQLAGLAGVTLGGPTYISENSPVTPVPYLAVPGIAQSGAGPTTPISPGQTDISLDLQVAYAIQ